MHPHKHPAPEIRAGKRNNGHDPGRGEVLPNVHADSEPRKDELHRQQAHHDARCGVDGGLGKGVGTGLAHNFDTGVRHSAASNVENRLRDFSGRMQAGENQMHSLSVVLLPP